MVALVLLKTRQLHVWRILSAFFWILVLVLAVIVV
jgi:hypothetical protein